MSAIYDCDNLEMAFSICREKDQPITAAIPFGKGRLIYKVFPSGRAVGPQDEPAEVAQPKEQ